MNSAFTYCLYLLAVILLTLSLLKDKGKTKLALKKSCKMFFSVLPQFLAILFLMSLLLSVFDSATIQQIIGAESGVLGMAISSLVGAIALVPVLVAFPVAAELLKSGAGIIQIAVFISTLTTVGFVTLPLEAKYLGRKIAILRNSMFFLLAFVVALIMGVALT